MTVHWADDRVTVHHGDARDRLAALLPDAIVILHFDPGDNLISVVLTPDQATALVDEIEQGREGGGDITEAAKVTGCDGRLIDHREVCIKHGPDWPCIAGAVAALVERKVDEALVEVESVLAHTSDLLAAIRERNGGGS